MLLDIMNIAGRPHIQSYIAQNICDPWKETPFSGYRSMDNKQKGALGEMLVREHFIDLGHEVKTAETSTSGYDLIIDGIRTEVKFSLAHTDIKNNKTKTDCFTMNHVAVGKNWERLIFLGVNQQSDPRFVFTTKELFVKALNKGEYFSRQQGGKHGNNDDYMIAGAKLKKLIESEYMKGISEW